MYNAAIAYQKEKFGKYWKPFSEDMISKEILENRQWKIIMDKTIACIFVTALNDPLIWEDRDKDDAIYLHRIVTNPAFRGNNFVSTIVKWAKGYAKLHNKKFIRMDTWGDNEKLNDYYLKCGFTFLGLTAPKKVETLPPHYEGITLSLFQMSVDF